MSVEAREVLGPGFVAGVARDGAESRAGGCTRPVRLTGSTVLVDTRTGEVQERYPSASELDGHTYVRCGNPAGLGVSDV